MARVQLSRREAEGDLPAVCMRCGAEADVFKAKTFSWCPSWVAVLLLGGLLPYVIVAMILTKRMRVEAPLCQGHKGHWMWRSLFTLGGLVVILLLAVAAGILSSALDRHPTLGQLGGFACAGVGLLGLIWLVAAAVLQITSIRAAEITERSITLIKVSPDFADAVADAREERYEKAERRPRRRRPRDEDEDEEEWEQRR